ncbi:MAG: MoaD/ThiS family protein [Candidatus Thorarchaeota archaeon]
MKVKVKLFATLRNYGPTNVELGESFSVTFEESVTVATLLEILKIPRKEAKLILINGNNGGIENELIEGDTVAIFPPVGGGYSL